MIINRERGTRITWPGPKPPDEVQLPQEPSVLRVLEKYGCTVKLADNCFDLVNERGDAIAVPYGASLVDWEEAARLLHDFE